jgi:hypothetical protein
MTSSLLREIVERFITAELASGQDQRPVAFHDLQLRLKTSCPNDTATIEQIYTWCSKSKNPSVKQLLQDHPFSFCDVDSKNPRLTLLLP